MKTLEYRLGVIEGMKEIRNLIAMAALPENDDLLRAIDVALSIARTTVEYEEKKES